MDGRKSSVDDAEEWLLEYLDGTPKPAKALQQAAGLADIGEYGLMSAKKRLGIVSRNEGGSWVWYPPRSEAIA